MTKRTRLVLLVLAGTVFNILATLLCFALFLLLYAVLLIPRLPADKAFMGFPLLFLASVILAFLAYRRVLKRHLRKHPLPQNTEAPGEDQ